MLLGNTVNLKGFNSFAGLGWSGDLKSEWYLKLTGEKLANIHTPSDSAEDFSYNLEVLHNGEHREVNLRYRIYKRVHENSKVLFEQDVKITLESGKAIKLPINYAPFIDSFGVYYTWVGIFGDGEAPLVEQVFSISYVRMPEEPNKRLGMNIHESQEFDNYTPLKIAAACGVKKLRVGIGWGDVEKECGVYKYPEWHEEYIDEALSNGMEIMGLFIYYNDLYDNGQTPHSDEAINAYANFCADAVRRYKGKIKHYEIWNEYNFWGAFNNSNEPPETYARMLIATSKAMKAVDPNVKVVACSTCGCHYEWVRRVMAAGAAPYIDILAPHPYSAIPCVAFPDEGKGDTVGMCEEFRKIAEAYGKEVPIWMTEVGWASQQDISGLTREWQAAATARALALTATMREDDALFWYDFLNDGLNAYDVEHNWGFVESRDASSAFAAKESYLAASAFNSKLANADFVAEHRVGSNVKVLEFEKSGKAVFMIWALGANETIALRSLGNTVTHTDLYGNERLLNSSAGSITVTASVVPQYLEGVSADECEKSVFVVSKTNVPAGECAEIKLCRNFKASAVRYEMALPDAWSHKETVIGENGCDILKIAIPVCEDERPFEIDIKCFADTEEAASLLTEIEVVPPLVINAKPMNANGAWKLTARIENNMNQAHIGGRLRITEPKNWRQANNPLRVEVKAGQSSEIEFTAPDSSLEEVTVGFEYLLDNGKAIYSYHRLGFMGIESFESKPEINGKVTKEKWGEPLITLTEKDFVPYQGNPVQDGFKAELFMKWDTENFYVAAKVYDKTHFQDCTTGDRWQDLWDGDGIQMLFDPIRDTRTGRECYNEVCFALSSVTKEEIVWRFKTIPNRSMHRMASPKRAIVRENGVTLYEIAIPWWELLPDGDAPSAGSNYGVAFGVNDNNGNGFTGRMQYGDGICSWFDSGESTPALAHDIILL